jgi:signal transduction histidine kinase
MQDRAAGRTLFDSLLERPFPVAGTLALVLAVIEVAIDWATWLELDISALYGAPLVLAAVARNRRLLWGLTAALVVMTFAVYAAQVEPAVFSRHDPYFVNRALSALELGLTACLCHVWIEAAEKLERLRRDALDASRRKTQLLAAVSHDIRTPLTTIDLIADLIQRSADQSAVAEQLPDLVQRLKRNTRSLADFVTALVDISVLDTGRASVIRSEFSLNELLLQECERLQSLAEAKGLRLAVDAPQPPVRLLTDRIKLSRVLGNLSGNAIKFTRTGSVTMAAELKRDGSLAIRVVDTGIGMTPQELARIFEEYGQLGNQGRDSNRGWGLGLAICRRLAALLGGEITVESAHGRGTTFTVHLPRSCIVR